MTPAEQEAADRARRKEEAKAAYLEDLRAIEATRQQARRYGRQKKILSALARVENMAEALGVPTADFDNQPNPYSTSALANQNFAAHGLAVSAANTAPPDDTAPEVLMPRTLGIPNAAPPTDLAAPVTPPTHEADTETELQPRTLGI